MNLAILTIHLSIIAFLAWGGLLSLLCLARDGLSSRAAE